MRGTWDLLGLDRIATAIFCQVDLSTGEVRLVSAGHPPPLLVSGGVATFLEAVPTTPLGAPDAPVTEWLGMLGRGETLLFYTDGLTEVFRGEEEFGPERLMDEFSKCPGERADVILDSLWATIDDFADGGPQSDDMTALALCRCAQGTEIPA